MGPFALWTREGAGLHSVHCRRLVEVLPARSSPETALWEITPDMSGLRQVAGERPQTGDSMRHPIPVVKSLSQQPSAGL
jgi:hypothetical protein